MPMQLPKIIEIEVFFHPHRWTTSPEAIKLSLQVLWSRRMGNHSKEYIERFDSFVSHDPIVDAIKIIGTTHTNRSKHGRELVACLESIVMKLFPNESSNSIHRQMVNIVEAADSEISFREKSRSERAVASHNL